MLTDSLNRAQIHADLDPIYQGNFFFNPPNIIAHVDTQEEDNLNGHRVNQL